MEQCIRERLLAADIDLDRTLDRFLGNEDLYIKFMKKFLQDKNYFELQETMKAGNYELAFTHAHTLKGVVANLGMKGLYEVIVLIVNKLRGNTIEGIEEDLEILARKYEEVCKMIETL